MPDRLTPRAILDRLVAFPTVSRDSNLPLIDWVEEYLGSHGIACHRHYHEEGEKAALYAHVGPEAPGGVVLSGHSDVVPVTDQDWHTDPFEMTERGDLLYGRGTCDMKGFIACVLAMAPKTAVISADSLPGPLQEHLGRDLALQVGPREDVAVDGLQQPRRTGHALGNNRRQQRRCLRRRLEQPSGAKIQSRRRPPAHVRFRPDHRSSQRWEYSLHACLGP